MSDTTSSRPVGDATTGDDPVGPVGHDEVDRSVPTANEPLAGTPDPGLPTVVHSRREMTADEIAEAEGMAVTSRSFGRQTWDRFRRHKLAIFATVMLLTTAVLFFVVPIVTGFDELTQDTSNSFADPSLVDFPSQLFGTDQLGRSVFIRAMKGGQFSLFIAVTVAGLTTVIGTVIGALAGYFGKTIDAILSQTINLFLIVPLLVVLLIVAKRFDSPLAIAVVIAFFSWPALARIVRGLFLQYREQEFVLAAKAAGASSRRIMFRHIIPNVFGPIIVNTTLLIGAAIILESTLSFLGVGVTPPTPTLGNLVAESKGFVASKPHLILGPGGFVVLISLCINFLGDGLRDALDPTSRS